EMSALVEGLGFDVVPLSGAGAAKVAEAYGRWGKGAHAASLNFGDCFAYALARELGRPLLFVGEDFVATDIEAA
ncbi:type II toxin-antitoxin system VapC family toxin, partial [Phenylobacterium sp.]|uniref:type II toxin-antitoxin system VapC family toxin n=1 Tax=Phenylobacterium sp. TaxID=1871053 RepID=UPI002FD9DF80